MIPFFSWSYLGAENQKPEWGARPQQGIGGSWRGQECKNHSPRGLFEASQRSLLPPVARQRRSDELPQLRCPRAGLGGWCP
jgi:hypothetical protein